MWKFNSLCYQYSEVYCPPCLKRMLGVMIENASVKQASISFYSVKTSGHQVIFWKRRTQRQHSTGMGLSKSTVPTINLYLVCLVLKVEYLFDKSLVLFS